jgi:LacI family transcriptional regulator
MSIAKVAERAGVSPATVSLVINNKSSVAPATAEAVRAIIEEIGYEPPPLERRQGRRAVREAAQRVGVVAMMPGNWLSSPVYGDVLHGLETTARAVDASILLHHVPDPEQSQLEILAGKVDGLILFGGHPQQAQLGKLGALACVHVMGTPDEDAWCDHVTYKNSSIGYLAARYLLEKGHRKTACLALSDSGFLADRQRTFALAMERGEGAAQVLNGDGLVIPSANGQVLDGKRLSKLMDQLLASRPRPTGLFVTADIAVPPVYLQLLQRGLRPGKDIEVVSCNNERSLLNGLDPRPAVVDIHAEEVGRRAVERLLWRMQNRKAPAADLLIHPSLVESPV